VKWILFGSENANKIINVYIPCKAGNVKLKEQSLTRQEVLCCVEVLIISSSMTSFMSLSNYAAYKPEN
jgi:hypothetical protein